MNAAPLAIASWNINSVRKRIAQLERLGEETNADVICLQETKANVEAFPAAEIAAMGHPHQAVSGFGGYNGVGILSKLPLTEINRYPHCDRNDARHISATVADISVHSLYIPAGGDLACVERNPKFAHKLKFVDALREVVPENDPVFTWWSYRASDWQAANKGRRLDHIWVTQPLKARIAGVEVLTDIRHWAPPSDHVPVNRLTRVCV